MPETNVRRDGMGNPGLSQRGECGLSVTECPIHGMWTSKGRDLEHAPLTEAGRGGPGREFD